MLCNAADMQTESNTTPWHWTGGEKLYAGFPLIAASTQVVIHSAMVTRGHRKQMTFSYLKRKQKNS